MSTNEADGGHSTAEFALVLPVIVTVLLGLVQVGVLARDQVLVWNAAREAGRQAAIANDETEVVAAARRAAPGLAPDRLEVMLRGGGQTGELVTVEIRYRSAQVVPLAPLDDVLVHDATATFRSE